MVIRLIQAIGSYTIHVCVGLGRFFLFLKEAITVLFSTRPKINKTFVQMYRIGVESLTIVVLTGTFTGMVLALQSYVASHNFGGEQFIGVIVPLGMICELGPVLTGLMVAGRAGSAMAAELGTMRVTEQIDALKTLKINVFQYLIVPRMLASTIIFPFLTLFTMICGIMGGYFVFVYVLLLSPEDYLANIKTHVELYHIMGGLIKAAVFGFILTWVSTYKGYYTTGGTRDVGEATTESVVTSSIMILISNFFLTKLLERL